MERKKEIETEEKI
jgi:hypothetical protein